MYIPIVILVLLFVGLFIFFTPYRQGVIDFFIGSWRLITRGFARLGNFLTTSAPAMGTGLSVVGTILLYAALAFLAYVALAYVVIGSGILISGIIVEKTGLALLLIACLMVLGFLSLIPSIKFFRSIILARTIIGFFTATLAIYLMANVCWWGFGKINPELQGSIGRFAENQTTELTDTIDSVSVKTEGKLGKVGRIDEKRVFGYSKDGKHSELIEKGTKVRLITEFRGGKVSEQSEGMVFVALENENGDFVWSKIRLVPPHRVNWDFKRTDAEAEAEVAAKKASAERAETEARAKAEAQAKTVQPQEETAKQFSFMEVQKLDGTSYQNRIVLVKMDQNCVEFMQIWGNGHSIKYSGQKSGESFFGNYRHTVDGRFEEGKFELNSKTLEGKFERPGNQYASFRLI